MTLGAMREMALDQVQLALGVSVSITTPAGVVMETTGVWAAPNEESIGPSEDMARMEPRRHLMIRKTADVTAVPRGSRLTAPEWDGADALSWRVDGVGFSAAPDLLRVIVVRVSS